MHSIRSILSTGRDFEFLEGVRERERHAGAVEWVDMRRSIQRILNTIADSTRHRNVHAGSHTKSRRLPGLDGES